MCTWTATPPLNHDAFMTVTAWLTMHLLTMHSHRLVPLDKLDLRLVQIMYTTGDMAAIRGISPFDFAETTTIVDQPWINEQVRMVV